MNKIIVSAVALAAIALGACERSAVDPVDREWVTELSRVEYGGGRYVAVGHRFLVEEGEIVPNSTAAAIYSSTDGRQWELVDLDTPGILLDVTYGDGLWMAAGNREGELDEGILLTSLDGLVWTEVEGPEVEWRTVAYQGGQYVGVASEGVLAQYIFTSPDGEDWEVGEPVGALTPRLSTGGGWFALWGEAGWVALSEDGEEWEVVEFSPVNRITTLQYIDGEWIGYGVYDCCFGEDPDGVDHYRIRSPDGIEWVMTPVEPGRLILDLAGTDQIWVAVTEEGIARSTVLGQWTPAPGATDPERPVLDIVRGDDRFVAVGREAVWWSDDGLGWRVIPLLLLEN